MLYGKTSKYILSREVYGKAQQHYLDKNKYNYSPEFAIIIVLKYLLSPQEFSSFIDDINDALDTLLISTRRLERTQMYKYMGFPANWLKIKDAPYYDTTETHP